jgi:alkaline phosphatase D
MTSPKGPRLPLDRRSFLRLGAVAAGAAAFGLSAACAPGEPPVLDTDEPVNPDDFDSAERVDFAPDDVTLDETAFPLGVQSGGMTAATALLWGYAEEAGDKRLRVWREVEEAGQVGLVADETVSPNDGGFFSFDVDGLAPATWYHYAFFDDALGRRSTIGRFRTAWPEDWLRPLRVGAFTCTNWDHMPYVAVEKTGEEELDLCVHLGDMSYNDGAVTRDEYREKWKSTLADPGYRAALPRQGMYFAWDDHEISNDLNPERFPAEQLATAKDAFFEALPARRGADGQLWRSYRWGRTAEFFVMDCRTERIPSTLDTEDAVYISDEQFDWLKGALTDSPCHFKVLLNSVPATRFPTLWALSGDRWQGYAAQRQQLLDFLEDNSLENTFFLSGDFHVGLVSRLEADGFHRRTFEVAVGPSGNLGNPLGFLMEQEDYREDVLPSSQFLYGKGRIAVTTLVFDPRADAVRIQFVDPETGESYFDQWVGKHT